MAEDWPFSRIDQIGVMVRDLDRAVDYYQSLGIGPFKPMEGIVSIERRELGKLIDPSSLQVKVKVARLGGVDLELVQPVKGKSYRSEFLKTRGEGINHLGFYVDDVEAATAKVEAQGFTVLSTSRFLGGGGTAWFDTVKVGGVLFELIQWPPK